ncbi:Kinase [Hexamita inflata]|uniref:CMGC CDK n=1 Tax=Hexamita inflata TaxID=28002 RepID=A0AA86N6B5_9EUKA|nr:CMGC CDK [Hexamita inflata]
MDKYGRLTPLVSDENRPVLKIADFGLARGAGIQVRSYSHWVVTLWYRCPEVLLGCKKYNYSIDIWSVGCIFYELVTNKILFLGQNEKEQIIQIFQTFGASNENVFKGLPLWEKEFINYFGSKSPELLSEFDETGRDLFLKMMKMDPEQRISAKECLEHPYFK